MLELQFGASKENRKAPDRGGRKRSWLNIIFEEARSLNHQTNEKAQFSLDSFIGAGKETQTPGLFLGKEALYQLSYARMLDVLIVTFI